MNYKPAYNVYWPAERGHEHLIFLFLFDLFFDKTYCWVEKKFVDLSLLLNCFMDVSKVFYWNAILNWIDLILKDKRKLFFRRLNSAIVAVWHYFRNLSRETRNQPSEQTGLLLCSHQSPCNKVLLWAFLWKIFDPILGLFIKYYEEH